MSTARLLSAACLALLLAACGEEAPSTTDARAAAAAPTPEASPTGAVADATPTAESAPSTTAEFELTMPGVERWMAANRGVAALVASEPALEDTTAMDADEGTDAFVARLDAQPSVAAAIRSAGLSTRDYAMTTEAVVGALFAVGMLEAGAIKELPAELKDSQHVRFVQEHKDEITAMMESTGQADAG